MKMSLPHFLVCVKKFPLSRGVSYNQVRIIKRTKQWGKKKKKNTLMAINWPKNLTRNKETHTWSEEGLFLIILFHIF